MKIKKKNLFVIILLFCLTYHSTLNSNHFDCSDLFFHRAIYHGFSRLIKEAYISGDVEQFAKIFSLDHMHVSTITKNLHLWESEPKIKNFDLSKLKYAKIRVRGESRYSTSATPLYDVYKDFRDKKRRKKEKPSLDQMLFFAYLGITVGDLYLIIEAYKYFMFIEKPKDEICTAVADQIPIERDPIAKFDLYELAENHEKIVVYAEQVEQPLTNDLLREAYFLLINVMKNHYLTSIGFPYTKMPYSKESHYPLGLPFFLKEYDAVVAIARQGLRYAMFVEMSGIPLHIVHVHDRNGEGIFKWVSKVSDNEFKGKKVLVLENDVKTEVTIKLFLKNFTRYRPLKLDLLLTNPPGHTKTELDTPGFNKVWFLKEITEGIQPNDAVNILRSFIFRQKAFYDSKYDGRSLYEIQNNLETRLEKILTNKNLPAIIGDRKKAKLRRDFYRNLYWVASSRLDIQGVERAAYEHYNTLSSLLDTIEEKTKLYESSGLEPEAGYSKNLFEQLNKGFEERRNRNL